MAWIIITKGPEKGRKLKLNGAKPQYIGRKDAPITIADRQISRKHASLFKNDGQWYIQDLGSSNGTYVNETKVQDTMPLRSGDQIRMGHTKAVFGRSSAKPKASPGSAPPLGITPASVTTSLTDPPRSSDGPPRPRRATAAGAFSGRSVSGHADEPDASSILLDILSDDDEGDVGEYVPDYDPLDKSTHRSRRKDSGPPISDGRAAKDEDPTADMDADEMRSA